MVAGFVLNIVWARKRGAGASLRPSASLGTSSHRPLGINLATGVTMRNRRHPLVHVTIVAAKAETLDGLQGYLSLAGLDAHGTRHLSELGRRPCSAVIFFPDEFSSTTVLRELVRLRRDHPTVLPLLVTAEPQRYSGIPETAGKALRPVVIPKPAWGWTILDAIQRRVSP